MALPQLRTTDFWLQAENPKGASAPFFHGQAGRSGPAPLCAFAAFFKKIGRLAADPVDERAHVRMRQQCLGGVELPCQFVLGQERMDLPVADAVQQLGLAPAFGLGYKVMRVLLGRRNLAAAQRADRQRDGLACQIQRPSLLSFDLAQHKQRFAAGIRPQAAADAWPRCGRRRSSI